MTTPASLTAAELAAVGKAARAYLKANVPAWELNMVPQDKIDGLVTVVVAAVDAVRNAAGEQP